MSEPNLALFLNSNFSDYKISLLYCDYYPQVLAWMKDSALVPRRTDAIVTILLKATNHMTEPDYVFPHKSSDNYFHD